MGADGFLADDELTGHLCICAPGHHEDQDVSFPLGEIGQGVRDAWLDGPRGRQRDPRFVREGLDLVQEWRGRELGGEVMSAAQLIPCRSRGLGRLKPSLR